METQAAYHSMDRESIFREMERLKADGANILIPGEWIEQHSKYHQPVIKKVQIDTDPKNGEIYPDSQSYGDNKKYILHFRGKNKIATAAGVDWIAAETGCVVADKDKVIAQATGFLRGPDGRPMTQTDNYGVYFDVVRKELTAQYEKKAKKDRWVQENCKTESAKNAWIKNKVDDRFIFEQKHALTKAITGAKGRVIDKLLNLKGGYTMAELKKPFVMIRFELRPNLDNPETQRLMDMMVIGQAFGLFGPGKPSPFGLIEGGQNRPQPQQIIPATDDIIPEYTEPDPPAYEPQQQPTADHDAFDAEESQLLDFQNQDDQEQVRTLFTLIKRKGYDVDAKIPEAHRDIGAWKESNRERLFRTLIAMPDAGGMSEDDIPL